MATYKLIQDIEAEDHILGPLTLRQFIFALIAAFLIYICFILITKKVYFMLAVFVPPTLFFAFFALPFGRDQPTEIWFLAKLRFWFKPRKRVWNQSGVKELVTITVPKKVERIMTNGLSQTEVKSRLQALANTIDTRGWAVKNAGLGGYNTQPTFVGDTSDRLIDISTMPQPVPDNDIVPADDMLDVASSPIAQQFDNMINQQAQVRRQQMTSQLSDDQTVPAGAVAAPSQADDYWFMDTAETAGPAPVTQAAPLDPAEEAAITAQLKSQAGAHPAPYGHMRTMKPINPPPSAASSTPPPAVTPASDPAILSLANNDDLNVATLAREARKASGDDVPADGEINVPLR